MTKKHTDQGARTRADEVPSTDRSWFSAGRRVAVYAVLLTVLFVKVFGEIRDEHVFLGGDNADYFILAESIATGQGYRYIAFPEAEAHNHFPPGYPALMALFMKVGVTEINTLTALNGVFLWASLMILLLLFTRFSGSPELAAATIGLCTLNAHLLGFSTIMMSEVPYLFFFCVALGAYVMMIRAEERGTRSLGWLILLVCAAIIMVYIRTAGVASVLAVAMHMAWRKRWRWCAVLIAGVVLSQIPWQVRSMGLGGNSYVKQMLQVNPYRPELGPMTAAHWPERVGSNLKRYSVREVPGSVMPWTTRKSDSALQLQDEWWLSATILPLIIVGLVLLRRERVLVLLVMLGSFSVLMLWPTVWTGVRFMLALVPFTVFLSCYGLYALLVLLARRFKLPVWSAWVPFTPVLFVVLSYSIEHILVEGRAYTNANLQAMAKQRVVKVDRLKKRGYALCYKGLAAESKNPYADGYNEFLSMSAWVGKNLPKEGTVVCCRKPGLFYLFARRKVTTYAKTLSIDSLISDLKEKKVTHIIVDQMGFADLVRYLVPAVQRDALKFPIIRTEAARGDKKKLTYLLAFKPELGYEGRWVNARKQGQGRMKFSDGSWLDGIWVNDTLNGQGVLHRTDSSLVEGQWFMGALNGHGRIVTKTGQVLEEGEWKNGKKVGSTATAPAASGR